METTEKKEFQCECGKNLDLATLERFPLRTGCRSYSPAFACTACNAIYFNEGPTRAYHRDKKKAFLEE